MTTWTLRAAGMALLALGLPASARASGSGAPTLDRGITLEGGSEDVPPRVAPHGDPCEGVNHSNDAHFDPAFTGGPLIGWDWTPASSVRIDHVEIYTGEVDATSRLGIWSDDGGSPSQPLAALAFTLDFPTGVPKAWYGADLVDPVDVVAGTKYWVVWDPLGNEQVSATDDPADVQTSYWGSFSGTVEGGASWFGPFTFTDRRWKARMTCGDGTGGCEDPSMTTAGAESVACNHGIVLSWAPATFPGSGNGAYHVHRSTVGFADAMSRPPIAEDVRDTAWVDAGTSSGETYFHIVVAESLDFPGCGEGPLVGGSTASLDIGPTRDEADVTAPSPYLFNALRATGHGVSTVDFTWELAPPLETGEAYLVTRSDDRADGTFAEVARTGLQDWTDLAVPPRAETRHVWFYDVRITDACGNVSED